MYAKLIVYRSASPIYQNNTAKRRPVHLRKMDGVLYEKIDG